MSFATRSPRCAPGAQSTISADSATSPRASVKSMIAPRPGLQAFARSYEHLPPGQLVRARLGSAAFPQQKHLCRTARAALGAQKARRHDAGLVGDQQVAGFR